MTEEKVIDRIRALLAKAERTDFEQESEAFLAKATELMARYRVDEAVLVAAGKAADDPVDRTVLTLTKWHVPKGSLAIALGEALDCHLAWAAAGRGQARKLAVIGHLSDLETFTALFTSLEIQLDRELHKVKGYSTGETRAMRSSFAQGWVSTVSQRISEHHASVMDEAVASSADSTSVALVLADRQDVVAAKYEEFYGRKPRYSKRRRSYGHSGSYGAGASAGHRADIGTKGVSGVRGSLST
jgi:hypothetical protein